MADTTATTTTGTGEGGITVHEVDPVQEPMAAEPTPKAQAEPEHNEPEPEPKPEPEPEPEPNPEDKLGDAGKRALTSLRRENRALVKENDQLREQVEQLRHERYEARVERLATGKLRYPKTAIRLLDGVDADSDDKAITKAIDVLLKDMPGLGSEPEPTSEPEPAPDFAGAMAGNGGNKTAINAALFAGKLSQFGI